MKLQWVVVLAAIALTSAKPVTRKEIESEAYDLADVVAYVYDEKLKSVRPMYPIPPLSNPDLPHEHEIYGGGKEGTTFYFEGRVVDNPGFYGFFINFQVDNKSPDNTIAFHFNPRFEERITVRNSRLGPEWGPEERQAMWFPFEPGQEFVLEIDMLEDKFSVAIDGNHFIDYQYRFTPICDILVIRMSGDVVIHKYIQYGPPIGREEDETRVEEKTEGKGDK